VALFFVDKTLTVIYHIIKNILQMKNRNQNHSDNWATPKYFYDQLDAEFHFDFDPCPLNAGEITPENDGLLKEWGSSNFVNPPYSKALKDAFVKKAIEESKKGKVCVLLLPVSTSTRLFHDHIKPNAREIRFIDGRIPFGGYNTFGEYVDKIKPMHDSMVVIFGKTSRGDDSWVRIGNIKKEYMTPISEPQLYKMYLPDQAIMP
jgi:phage N-6-adenine-methyltransferase